MTIRVPRYVPNMDAGRLAPSMDVVWCASELRILHLYSIIIVKRTMAPATFQLKNKGLRLFGTFDSKNEGLGFSVYDF